MTEIRSHQGEAGLTGPAGPLVLDLRDVAADMLPLAGGKAVNLGILIRAGLPVPPGCCLTTEAYGRVAAEAGLGDV